MLRIPRGLSRRTGESARTSRESADVAIVAGPAELLGIYPGTVKSHTAALAALREVLGDDAEGTHEHTQEASNAH